MLAASDEGKLTHEVGPLPLLEEAAPRLQAAFDRWLRSEESPQMAARARGRLTCAAEVRQLRKELVAAYYPPQRSANFSISAAAFNNPADEL